MNGNILSAELISVLTRSQSVARRLGRRMVESDCLLAGLTLESESVRDLFREVGLEGDSLMSSIIPHKEEGDLTFPDETGESIPLSGEASRQLRLAALEARRSGASQATAEHLLLGLLRDEQSSACRFMNSVGLTYKKVIKMPNFAPNTAPVDSLGAISDDEDESMPSSSGSQPQTGRADAPTGDTPTIDRFGIDLTKRATEGALDPVVGREKETLRVAQILCRRKKNNPIIIGAPGVGKSAIVEGLAQMIAEKRAPNGLQNRRIVALDMAAIVAGTQFRGQFEERLRALISEMKEHPEILLFVDEIHTMVGAGSAAGTLDAANILKPALARGEVQCIGATTDDEFRRTIEKDGALDRRFQRVRVEACNAEESLIILKRLRSRYEEHHHVRYTDEALEACVKLTDRYVNNRSLPDKAIDAMDEAGSRVRLSFVNRPPEIVEKEREMAETREEKMRAAENQDYELAARLRDRVTELGEEIDRLNDAWLKETESGSDGLVDVADVAEVVSMISGVPAGRMSMSENERLRNLPVALNARVIAQEEAVSALARAITASRIGLKGRNRPIGTFLFVGPTGVGKTHLVKCLAEQMFDSSDALIRVDMSEYGEKHTTSRLMGAPPGYVGYEQGGQLTERVRRRPYSIVLLDEIEKAHPDVFNTLLQVMDEGRMTDGNGITVDFRNTIIVMTSNSGSRTLSDFGDGIGFGTKQESDNHTQSVIQKSLRRIFAPEFLNRLDDIVLFKPLSEDSALKICEIELNDLRKRMEQNMGLTLTWSEDCLSIIVKKGFNKTYGARSLKRTINELVETPLTEIMMSENPPKNEVKLYVEEGKIVLQ